MQPPDLSQTLRAIMSIDTVKPRHSHMPEPWLRCEIRVLVARATYIFLAFRTRSAAFEVEGGLIGLYQAGLSIKARQLMLRVFYPLRHNEQVVIAPCLDTRSPTRLTGCVYDRENSSARAMDALWSRWSAMSSPRWGRYRSVDWSPTIWTVSTRGCFIRPGMLGLWLERV